jgi:putative transposase
METHLRTELVLQALDMALLQRRPNEVIHHSDQGCQYTSVAFGKRCGEAGVRPSMGSVGDAYDNAMCESFFATLECELLDRNRFRSQVEARIAVFQFIEGWYNPHRLHSGLGYLSPIEFERRAGAELPLVSIDGNRSEETTVRDRGGKIPLGLPLENQHRFHRHEEEDQERGLNPSP